MRGARSVRGFVHRRREIGAERGLHHRPLRAPGSVSAVRQPEAGEHGQPAVLQRVHAVVLVVGTQHRSTASDG